MFIYLSLEQGAWTSISADVTWFMSRFPAVGSPILNSAIVRSASSDGVEATPNRWERRTTHAGRALMAITEEVRDFGNRFAESVRARDYETAHFMLASWLREEITTSALKDEIEKCLLEMADEWELEGLTYPDAHQVDSGVLSADDLRQPGMASKPVPDQLTAENFVHWMCIQFLAADDALDLDAWFDWWMAVVRDQGELAIGYFEIQDPD